MQTNTIPKGETQNFKPHALNLATPQRNSKTNKNNYEHYGQSNKSDYPTNQSLINELHYLLSNQEVVNRMDKQLYQRVQNVLSKVKSQNHTNQKQNNVKCKDNRIPSALGQINYNNLHNTKNNKFSIYINEELCKIKTENSLSLQKNKKTQINKYHKNLTQYEENEQCIPLFDSYKQNHLKTHKLLKQKNNQKKSATNGKLNSEKQINKSSNKQNKQNCKQKSLKMDKAKSECKINKMKFKIIPSKNQSIQKDSKSIRSSSKSLQRQLGKPKSMQKLQKSNLKFGTSKQNSKIKHTTSSFLVEKEQQKQQKQWSNKKNSHISNYKSDKNLKPNKFINNKLSNQHNEQKFTTPFDDQPDNENKYQNNDDSDIQELFSNQQHKKINSQNYQSNATFLFKQKVYDLQRQTEQEKFDLEEKIKKLKNSISTEKQMHQSCVDRMSLMKQQIKSLNINTSHLLNKKKKNHIKLQGVWNQVKGLNCFIKETQEQNQQVKTNIDQQQQLTKMYQTVIEQVKQQLKIEIQSRDNIKNKLSQSKKVLGALKHKAKSTKEKNDIILGTVKESLSKWIG